MPAPTTALQVNFGGQGAANPYLPTTQGMPPMPYTAVTAEGYRFYQQMIEAKGLYQETITLLLYDAQLVPIDSRQIGDLDSPIPGTALRINVKTHKPACTYDGYKTLMGMTLFFTNAAISTSKTDDTFKLEDFSVNAAMSLMRMLVAKRAQWEFTNFALLRPIGLAIWQNIYHIETRSSNRGGGKRIIDMVFHPNMFFDRPQEDTTEKKGFHLW